MCISGRRDSTQQVTDQPHLQNLAQEASVEDPTGHVHTTHTTAHNNTHNAYHTHTAHSTPYTQHTHVAAWSRSGLDFASKESLHHPRAKFCSSLLCSFRRIALPLWS
jgi:hypothetical protein